MPGDYDRKTSETGQFNWHVSLYAAAAAVLVFLPLVISPNIDFLYLFFIVPALVLLGICALIHAAIMQNWSTAVIVVSFWAVSAILFGYNVQIRTLSRWVLWSGHYKNEVLAQPAANNGDLKHIEWDGWGWAGQDTGVFLVFDPTDALSVAAQSARPGKFKGIPCEVYRVRRLERNWYTVQNYTDQDWGQCN